MKIILLTAMLVVFGIFASGQTGLGSIVGTVNSTSEGGICIAVQNAKLKRGQTVTVVFPDRPQSITRAVVKAKVRSSCSSEMDVGEHESFYLLRMPKRDRPFVAIGVVGTVPITARKGVASGDINGDGKKEYFRACTGREGVHSTIWTGKPLRGRRIWHSYYYLSYETEPSCKEKDYVGTED